MEDKKVDLRATFSSDGADGGDYTMQAPTDQKRAGESKHIPEWIYF